MDHPIAPVVRWSPLVTTPVLDGRPFSPSRHAIRYKVKVSDRLPEGSVEGLVGQLALNLADSVTNAMV
jgi:hypothetical protein